MIPSVPLKAEKWKSTTEEKNFFCNYCLSGYKKKKVIAMGEKAPSIK